ncbi:hypothetical protein JTE90_020516 [Oedothorax gibbosus]|uniref:Uncharacterized protein n=1 Tax=Oedothorax gibbosus TaxID=931172 RepID=A0AAV6TN43_9ARAC|nr:hypothetical protein JTE90_020516 [Oedothorax gibbosus]
MEKNSIKRKFSSKQNFCYRVKWDQRPEDFELEIPKTDLSAGCYILVALKKPARKVQIGQLKVDGPSCEDPQKIPSKESFLQNKTSAIEMSEPRHWIGRK